MFFLNSPLKYEFFEVRTRWRTPSPNFLLIHFGICEVRGALKSDSSEEILYIEQSLKFFQVPKSRLLYTSFSHTSWDLRLGLGKRSDRVEEILNSAVSRDMKQDLNLWLSVESFFLELRLIFQEDLNIMMTMKKWNWFFHSSLRKLDSAFVLVETGEFSSFYIIIPQYWDLRWTPPWHPASGGISLWGLKTQNLWISYNSNSLSKSQ